MSLENPFHEGELIVQQRAKESAYAQRNSAVISKTLQRGAIPFVAQQSLVVIGSLNPQGDVWASVLVGAPGFIRAVNEQTLLLDVQHPLSAIEDPLWANLETNMDVGMLVIDLETRRRLRINGRMQRLDSMQFVLDVIQAYANCPKYIQQRRLSLHDEIIVPKMGTLRQGNALVDGHIALISKADTFFVASAHPSHGVDTSHRGGYPGFVRILDRQRIRIPDYSGNSLFNTLGNLTVYPRAGLVFLDFETGRVLQLSGRAKILWDQDDSRNQTGGTGRYWELNITQWVETQLPRKLTWESPEYSPYNPASLQDSNNKAGGMKLVVRREIQKTQRIKAFQLSAVDGAELPVITAGAHLPVRVHLPDGTLAYRPYSILSDSTDRSHYEIAVLLESDGLGGSRFMHESLRENQTIEASMPHNDFPLHNDTTHHILIAGGIGITPILSMLKSLVANKSSLELHYAARTVNDLAYKLEIELLCAERAYFYHSEGPEEVRLNLEQVMSNKNGRGTHIYVCGPLRMIQSVRALADKYDWTPEQIHFEAFW